MEKEPWVILKLSGELFGSPGKSIDFDQYDAVANTLIDIRRRSSIQLVIVPGGGNIFRGRDAGSKVNPVEADWVGMTATIQNGILLREALIRNGEPNTRLMTAIEVREMAEPFLVNKAIHHLANGRMIILAGGLGMSGFSTDSAAAQRAYELDCQIILKASTVDGVYDSDPRKNPQARRFERVTFREAIERQFQVMDATAFTLCRDRNIPIFVFNIDDLSRIPDAIAGDYSFGTLVSN